MDVSCPQCNTLFELQDSRLSVGSVTLECSECNHRFRIQAKFENLKRWMLRSISNGDILYFNTFDTLYQWMMSQKVSKQDEISRSGKKWTSLESIGEFTPVFQVLDSIKDLLPKSPTQDPLLDLSTEIKRQQPQRPRVQTVPQFSNFATPTSSWGSAGQNEKPETTAQIQSSHGRRKSETTDSLEIQWYISGEFDDVSSPMRSPEEKSSKRQTWFLALLVLVAVLSGVGFLMTMKRNSQVISLNKAPRKSNSKQIPFAKTVISSAVTQSIAKLESRNAKIWDVKIGTAKGPVYNSIEKATQRSKKKADRANTDTMLQKGIKALERGNLALARGAFIHVLDLEPKNSEAITGMGWVRLEGGNTRRAAKEFRKAIRINPSYGEAYMGLGQSLRESGQLQEALNTYNKYLQRHPQGSRAGIARYQQKELKKRLGIDKGSE